MEWYIDQLTASCLKSYYKIRATQDNTIPTMGETAYIYEFFRKLWTYDEFFFGMKAKDIIATKLLEEFKLFILTTNCYVIEKAIQTIRKNTSIISRPVVTLIMYHIYSTSDIAAHHNLARQLAELHTPASYLSNKLYSTCSSNKYLDTFYQEMTPSEFIHTIHSVWKSFPEFDFILIMSYCGRLLEKKEHKKFKNLVYTEMEFFAVCLKENFKSNRFQLVADSTWYYASFTVLFFILHCSIIFNNQSNTKENIENTSIPCIFSSDTLTEEPNFWCFNKSINGGFNEGFYNFLQLLHKDQLACTKQLVHQLFLVKEISKSIKICAIINTTVKLMENKYHDKSTNFLRHNLGYVQNVTKDQIKSVDCKTRCMYSRILLEVLHTCSLSKDINGIQLAVGALYSLKVSLLDIFMTNNRCYCYMGSEKCGKDSNMDNYNKTETFLSSEYLQSYWYSYKDNKEGFVKKLKKLNGKLFTCSKKRQQLHNLTSTKRASASRNIDEDDSYNRGNDYDEDDNEGGYTRMVDLADSLYAILEHIAYECDEENELKEFVKTLCQIELNPAVEDLYIMAISNFVYVTLNNRPTKIALFVLDINKCIQECSLLTKLTLKVGECLNFSEEVIKDKNKVIYKCFCKLRHAVNNGDLTDINIDEYQEHFTFIKSMETEEEMEKIVKCSEFLIIVMLLLMVSTYGGHHKSAEMKKYLSLKYEYDKAILYLLWCSGDVEINPGPTLKKLKSVPASQKLRAWIWDMCSILLKTLKKISVDSKPKDLWKDKPANWPCDQPFYDPRNKSKGGNEDVKSDDRLLKCILDLCSQQLLNLSQYQSEITAWRDENKKLLFELYTCRMEIQKIKTYTQSLINYKDTLELQQMLCQKKIQIAFSVPNFKNDKVKGTTDVIREVAVLLCKISKQIPPMDKIDGIWKTPPIRWKAGVPFYSPHNAGARTEKGQDKTLVNNLVEYIETENIDIPPEYTALVTAWKQQNMQELFKLYIVHTNVAVIENSLKYLQLEGLLDKPDVLDKLKHEGLTLSTEWFDGCSTSTVICDSNQASTSHQSTYVNLSNAQQNSNGRNGNKFNNANSAPSYRKRSNPHGIPQSKDKYQNKKRKLPHEENIGTTKKREKLLTDNDTLNKISLITNLHQVVSLEEDKTVHLTNGTQCSDSPNTNDNTEKLHIMSNESIQQTNEVTDIHDIDFLFASKIIDKDITADIHRPPRLSDIAANIHSTPRQSDIAADIHSPPKQPDSESLKTIDEEITEIKKKLDEEPPEMDDVSKTLNISTNELSHIIDQYRLLCYSGADNDKNNNNDHTENDLDIDLCELDTCESDDGKL